MCESGCVCVCVCVLCVGFTLGVFLYDCVCVCASVGVRDSVVVDVCVGSNVSVLVCVS